MSNADQSTSAGDKLKLEEFMRKGVAQLQEMEDIRGSLNDLAKHVAEETGRKPKDLMIAVRTAFKNDLDAKKEAMDAVAEILHLTGYNP